MTVGLSWNPGAYSTTRPSVLLYDQDCRICSSAARLLHGLGPQARIQIRSLQDAASLAAASSQDDWLRAARFYTWDGRLVSGGDVLPALAAAWVGRPELERLVRASHAAMGLANRTYDALAGIRGRLTCGVAPSSS